MNNELAIRDGESTSLSGFEMHPKTLGEAMKFCEIMAESELVPKDFKGKPGNILVAIQMGRELGLSPMRALRSIAVINGRASMWGDELLAMVLASPVCEYVDESESTDKAGICKVKRKGSPPHLSIFTLEDAKRAGLLGKQGPWQQHTKRMLTLRARGFALRDKFADVLAGLVTTEEAIDLPADAPKVTPESEPPATLKDKLKQKVEALDTEGAAAAPPGAVSESEVPPVPLDTSDAPSPSGDLGQLMDLQAELDGCATKEEAQAWWDRIVKEPKVSSENRQSLYPKYQQAVKRLKK